MTCPYSSEELDYWDGCTNPMGEACNHCGEWECEHNPHDEDLSDEVDDLMYNWDEEDAD